MNKVFFLVLAIAMACCLSIIVTAAPVPTSSVVDVIESAYADIFETLTVSATAPAPLASFRIGNPVIPSIAAVATPTFVAIQTPVPSQTSANQVRFVDTWGFPVMLSLIIFSFGLVVIFFLYKYFVHRLDKKFPAPAVVLDVEKAESVIEPVVVVEKADPKVKRLSQSSYYREMTDWVQVVDEGPAKILVGKEPVLWDGVPYLPYKGPFEKPARGAKKSETIAKPLPARVRPRLTEADLARRDWGGWV